MILTLIVAAAAAMPGPAGDGELPAWNRQPSLDSLAAGIQRIGDIPEAPDLLLLSAWLGWPGMISSVSFIPGGSQGDIAPSPQVQAWGAAPPRQGMDSILVIAPWPTVLPVGLTVSAQPGETLHFGLAPDTSWSRAFLSTPAPGAGPILPDSSGLFALVPSETGVYWIEAVKDGDSGPVVVILLPLFVGVTVLDALRGCPGVYRQEAATLGQVRGEMDSLRNASGLQGLGEDPGLDSLARVRATEVALSGRVDHSGLLSRELPGNGLARAENVARGEGLDEAWRMVLASPAHLATCLSPRYSTLGMGASVEVDRNGWQVVLVQIFEGAGP